MSTSSITSSPFSSISTTPINSSSINYDYTKYEKVLQTLKSLSWPANNPEYPNYQTNFPEEISSLITEYVIPRPLFIYELPNKKFIICDVDGNLLVQKYENDQEVSTSITIERILLKANQRKSYENGQGINDVLYHKNFNRERFIEHVLSPNKLGIPRLFRVSNAAALDILDILAVRSKTKDFDPQKAINPISKRNYFIQAAHWRDKELLDKLIELFPKAFLSVGPELLEELGKCKFKFQNFNDYVRQYAEKYQKAGGKLDTFHSLLIKVSDIPSPELIKFSERFLPVLDETFEKDFASLSKDKQKILYDVAFNHINPFIFEQPDRPVEANQYSINLMWINKNKMTAQQQFLLGDSKEDFYKNFVEPVAKWAKANTGSTINIWFDGTLATEGAIERSSLALQRALDGTSHGKIIFRDVRSIKTVQENPQAFSETIPVYFRVDLLRALAAEHILSSKETKFFVYGDIDMIPLSRQRIFDKRTIDFLNEYGFVMAQGGCSGFENGFYILNGANEQFMKSHREAIIDINLKEALEDPSCIQEQQVYASYPGMFFHILYATGRYSKLRLTKHTELSTILKNSTCYDSYFLFRARDCFARNKCYKIFPRKPVILPTSHFGVV